MCKIKKTCWASHSEYGKVILTKTPRKNVGVEVGMSYKVLDNGIAVLGPNEYSLRLIGESGKIVK